MATVEELQRQLDALQQKVDALTAPPTDYYTHRWSGEEIDNGIDRARPGGEIDAALSNKVDKVRTYNSGDITGIPRESGTYVIGPNVTGLPFEGGTLLQVSTDGYTVVLTTWLWNTQYIRVCIGDTWADWVSFSTASPPQEFQLPLASGFSAAGVCAYYKAQNGMVIVIVNISGAVAAKNEVTIATLPVGYRPSSNMTVPAYANYNNDGISGTGYLAIYPSGAVNMRGNSEWNYGHALAIFFAS